MNNYRQTAQGIIDAVGKDNIISAAHCATRLSLVVKDREAINDKAVENVDMVKGVFYTGGQYQIILGTGIVNKVFDEAQALGLPTGDLAAQKEELKKQEKGFKKIMTTLGDIFVPIIPVIAATGLFLGLKGLFLNDTFLALFGMNATMIPEYITTLVTVLTDTAFAFLPAIIVWSAFKVFGGTPVIGMVIGLMLVCPALPNAYSVADPANPTTAIMAFGFIPLVGCQGSVLTALAAGWIGSKLERFFRKHMPNVFDLIMTPFFVMLLTMLAVLLGVGPIMHQIELGLVGLVGQLIHLPFGLGGFIIGFTYPLAVITGLHHSYIMIETSLLANTSFNPLITLCGMYGFANVGTCIAFLIKSKHQKVRQTASGAMASQLFGISEPVLFGLQLRWNLRPLLIMCFCSGIGAALLSIFAVQANAYGLAVVPSYLLYIYSPYQLGVYFAVSIGVVVLCALLTYFFGIPKEAIAPEEEAILEGKVAFETPLEGDLAAEGFLIPVQGKQIPLESVNSEVFAKKMLGDGFAVVPEDGIVRAPISGTLETVFPTKHAYGIRNANGEVLIHIGVDTVELNGECFESMVKQGDYVHQGDILCKVDLELLKNKNIDSTVMIILTDGKTCPASETLKAAIA